MADLDRLQPYVAEETGLAVVATTRADGTVQATVVDRVMAQERRTVALVMPRRVYTSS